MNADLLKEILAKNSQDIETIVSKIGGTSGLIAILPSVINILQTVLSSTQPK